MKKLIPFFAALLILAGCATKVQTGDLLFIGIPADYSITDDDMAGAIFASTGSGELNIIHVAILEVSEGQTYIIDATLAHGVNNLEVVDYE